METPPPQYPGYGPDAQGQSNYPRQMPYGYAPVPPRPPRVSLGAIREGWELMTQDMGTWVAASLVLMIFGMVLSVPLSLGFNYLFYGSVLGAPTFELNARWLFSQVGGGAVESALVTPFLSGIYWMCLKRIRGQQYSLRDLFYGLRFFPALAVVGFFSGVLMYLGFLLFVIPGLYMMGVLALAPLVAMDQRCGGLEAIRVSYQALRAHGFPMAGLMFLLCVMVGLSAMMCCVPILFTLPVYYFALALHYHAFFPPQEMSPTVPIMPTAPQYSV